MCATLVKNPPKTHSAAHLDQFCLFWFCYVLVKKNKHFNILLFLFLARALLAIECNGNFDLTLFSVLKTTFGNQKLMCVKVRSYFCYLMCRKQVNENTTTKFRQERQQTSL